MLVIAILPVAAVWTVLYNVRLPHEVITLKSGRYDVGYVLSTDDDWVSILRSGQRSLVRYDQRDVARRELCQLNTRGLLNSGNATLWNVWTRTTGPVRGPVAQRSCPRPPTSIP